MYLLIDYWQQSQNSENLLWKKLMLCILTFIRFFNLSDNQVLRSLIRDLVKSFQTLPNVSPITNGPKNWSNFCSKRTRQQFSLLLGKLHDPKYWVWVLHWTIWWGPLQLSNPIFGTFSNIQYMNGPLVNISERGRKSING